MGQSRYSLSSTEAQVTCLLLLVIIGGSVALAERILSVGARASAPAGDLLALASTYGFPIVTAMAAAAALFLIRRFFEQMNRLQQVAAESPFSAGGQPAFALVGSAECRDLAALLQMLTSQGQELSRLCALREARLHRLAAQCESAFKAHASRIRKLLELPDVSDPPMEPETSPVTRILDEAKRKVDETASLARGTGEQLDRFRDLTTQGHGAAELTHEQLTALRHKSASLSVAIQEFIDRSQTVEQIAAAVKLIASEIDHVALNATIEAARAGEVGRGFSIVAAEMRSLAEQSKTAAQQMRQVLEEIQKSSRATLSHAMDRERSLDTLVESTRKTEGLLQSLRSEAATASETCSCVLTEVAGQSQALHQIQESISQLRLGEQERRKQINQREEIRRMLEAAEADLVGTLSPSVGKEGAT